MGIRDKRLWAGSGGALALWIFVACLVTRPGLAQSRGAKPFSEEERARLTAGLLVTRPTSEQRDGLRLLGGASWQVIYARPEVVFRALLDTEYYHRMLPGVSRAVLVSEHANVRRVRIEHKRGPLGTAYRLALEIDRKKRDIRFRLNDRLDSSLRAAWGFLSVHAHGRSQTLISYGVMADPGDGLLVALVRGLIHESLLKLPLQVRYFVEGKTGRARYGSEPFGGCADVDGSQSKQCRP